MKTPFPATLLITILLALASGCSTTPPNPTLTPDRVERAVRLAGYLGGRALMAERPAARIALEKTRDGLEDLVASEHWDIATAAAIAAQNGVGELAGPDGTLWITTGAMALELLTGESVDLSQNEYARAAVRGMLSGMNLALAKE